MVLQHIHIYEMPEEDKDLLFQLYEVRGKTIQNKLYPHKTEYPHRHNYYEICIFVNGAGKHEIDFKTFPINPNSIHFLTPGQVHLISRDENYHGYLLVFTRDFYSMNFQNKDILFDMPFFNNPAIDPILELTPEKFKGMLQLINNIKEELKVKNETTQDILKSYLHIFLLKCKEYFQFYYGDDTYKGDPEHILAGKFRKLVEQHFMTLHFVRDYAGLLAQTPTHLNKTIKKITGKNASEIIINRIVLEAKRLLLYTDLSNKEVAFRMNYDDPSYFSRVFKKKTGVSPSGFRMKMKKKYQF